MAKNKKYINFFIFTFFCIICSNSSLLASTLASGVFAFTNLLFFFSLLKNIIIIIPVKTTKEEMINVSKKQRIIKSIIGGIAIGLICGMVGAGGGMMLLLILTSFLGYEMHIAVGTSVFIMTFTALTGSISHFAMGDFPNITCLIL